MGIAMIEKKLAALPDFPSALRMLVEHMVLSHHGKLELGSPKLPMIPEAVCSTTSTISTPRCTPCAASLSATKRKGARRAR